MINARYDLLSGCFISPTSLSIEAIFTQEYQKTTQPVPRNYP
ncbi:hypothetical protein APHCRT_0238 [Anaplasma phagocytophilum str. CRT53-1]|uniref:Uncharacterized protein n=5 Tax=Anaplasma phagocytophilum TaxID=948 RepID=A0A0F3NJE9_ANAPH|nr:hypothetical protein APHWEB_0308 [Anaplasma phagocytophilum str. Webster]KJV64055.1 hypothetical protein APHMUC_1478 [Anaplasma phagocytophilum str. ApMUC09]KJV66944.1 hypothetical protein APHNP_1314 [Anaplasma phagocytophilum str. ApNP]KJV68168.1 hypothetical protein EPHNCH_0422 [Anaplasma phagocytophilum str. NCH-1]KJV82615.1 hypothetical protein APHHGE2_0434 [Anaplasma phagocytophilum str. HGE2]KJV84806.1 hypothetical protein APHWI1_1208 [Anaplasma phagocytophilum str. ApWI1]KJV88058.1 